MSISHAIDFLARVQTDLDFRKGCYKCQSHDQLLDYLAEQGYKFTELEFENAVNHLLLRCDTEDQAFEIHHLQSWFKLFQ